MIEHRYRPLRQVLSSNFLPLYIQLHTNKHFFKRDFLIDNITLEKEESVATYLISISRFKITAQFFSDD